jgi:hypothetical protein
LASSEDREEVFISKDAQTYTHAVDSIGRRLGEQPAANSGDLQKAQEQRYNHAIGKIFEMHNYHEIDTMTIAYSMAEESKVALKTANKDFIHRFHGTTEGPTMQPTQNVEMIMEEWGKYVKMGRDIVLDKKHPKYEEVKVLLQNYVDGVISYHHYCGQMRRIVGDRS